MPNGSRQYSGAELNNFLRPNMNRGFEIFDQNNNPLFSSTAEVPRSINWFNSEIRDVAERLNLIDICTEFYPSSESQTLANELGIKVDYQSYHGWSNWFQEITKKKTLMPDANVLVMRTIRSVIIPSLKLEADAKLPFEIVIPRLAILELENLANREPKQGKISHKGKYFLAFNEIRRLKNRLSHAIPLTYEEISSFNKGAGKGIADSLIRQEIQNYGEMTNAQIIYLTRDMVSALTANAEDLDAIYMAPRFPDQSTLEKVGLGETREMIIETATDYGSIVLKWDNDTSFKIEGVWSGKNWFDYSRQRVRITPI